MAHYCGTGLNNCSGRPGFETGIGIRQGNRAEEQGSETGLWKALVNMTEEPDLQTA